MQRMKALFNYKSQDTLGLLKGKARVDENASFRNIWDKTKQLLGEAEDIEGQKADAEGEWDDAGVTHAPEAKKHMVQASKMENGHQAPKPKEGQWAEAKPAHAADAKKHIQGSVSTDNGHQAPAPKEGHWEQIKIKGTTGVKNTTSNQVDSQAKAPKTGQFDSVKKHAPEASKNIQGSTSSDKGTQAPAPKKGDWDKVKKNAPEASKHVSESKKKTKVVESYMDEMAGEMDEAGGLRKSGNVPMVARKVMEINRLIELANANDVEVVNTDNTWQAPMIYSPLKYSNGVVYGKFKQLDLYRHNRGEGSIWKTDTFKILKRGDYGNSEMIEELNHMARMIRKALKAEGINYKIEPELPASTSPESMGPEEMGESRKKTKVVESYMDEESGLDQSQDESISMLMDDPQVQSLAKKLSGNENELLDIVTKLDGLGISVETLDKAAEAHSEGGDIDSIIGGEAGGTMNEISGISGNKKLGLWIAAVILAMSMSSCSITKDNNGFHIGRAFRNDGGGGCGAWHRGGSFRRR